MYINKVQLYLLVFNTLYASENILLASLQVRVVCTENTVHLNAAFSVSSILILFYKKLYLL